MTLIGAEELASLFARSGAPRSMGLFWRIERPKVNFLAVYCDPGSEPGASVVPINAARQFPDIRAVSVPSVLGKCCLTQVRKAVVQAIKVFVINVFRPLAGDHHPDHAMRAIASIVYADPNVLPVRRSCLLTREALVPIGLRLCMGKMVQRTMFPGERTRLGIIEKTLMQIRRVRLERHRQLFAMGAPI